MATQIVTTPSPERRDSRRATFLDNIVGAPAGVTAYAAFSIATAYPNRLPSWQEMADRYGMTRSTAYRYLATLRAVRGEA